MLVFAIVFSSIILNVYSYFLKKELVNGLDQKDVILCSEAAVKTEHISCISSFHYFSYLLLLLLFLY